MSTADRRTIVEKLRLDNKALTGDLDKRFREIALLTKRYCDQSHEHKRQEACQQQEVDALVSKFDLERDELLATISEREASLTVAQAREVDLQQRIGELLQARQGAAAAPHLAPKESAQKSVPQGAETRPAGFRLQRWIPRKVPV